MDTDSHSLGRALWMMRHLQDRSQKQVAQEASLAPTQLSAYESGRHLPSLENLARVLDALGVSFGDLEDALALVERGNGPPGPRVVRRASHAGTRAALRHLGDALRTLRTSRGMPHRELARNAGVSPAMLVRYETGRALPTLPTLHRLLRTLGASPADLDDLLDTGVVPIDSEVAEPAAAYSDDSAPYSFRVAGEVLRRLEDLDREYERAGRSLGALARAPELAARMVALVPSPSPWDELLGPFYGSRQVEALLGDVSRQAVAERRKRRTLLGLRTADGAWVYPTFQFGDEGDVVSGLPPILRCFDEDAIDDWTLAGWLVSPHSSLGGSSPIERLRTEGDSAAVRTVARDAARRFAQ